MRKRITTTECFKPCMDDKVVLLLQPSVFVFSSFDFPSEFVLALTFLTLVLTRESSMLFCIESSRVDLAGKEKL